VLSNRLVVITRDIRLLLIAVWLGAAVFFSFALAPTVFSVLPTRELAGNVVSRTLMILNLSGFFIGLLLFITAPIGRKFIRVHLLAVEMIALLTITLMTGIGHWIIAARLAALRLAMRTPIDELATTDSLRVSFNNLHQYSVIVLSVAMIAAIAALLISARRVNRLDGGY
jgi:hypothetical protein